MDDATNKTEDLIDDAKAKADEAESDSADTADGSDGSDKANDGQVTAVDATLGTDAGDGAAAPRRVGGEFENKEPGQNH